MAKTYYGQTSSGSHPPTASAVLTTPPASGPMMCLVYMGPSLGNQWNYSAAVNGTTTFYVVDNGPSLGRQRSAT